MAIDIDKNKCTGCNKCCHICPGNLLYMNNDNKAQIRNKKDCWDCASCMKECPERAISMTLQGEVGGRGSKLTAFQKDGKTYWELTHRNKSVEKIVISYSIEK